MRKYLLATLFLILFVCWMGPARQLLSRYLLQDEPTFHQIQDGEWLSKIALRYYGDMSYWRELELINRAPDGDHIFPGEEIIIPSFDILREIRKTQRLSRVNLLIHEQQTILAGRARATAPETAGVERDVAREIKTEVVESFEQPALERDASMSAEKPEAPMAAKKRALSEPIVGDDSGPPPGVTAFDAGLAPRNSTLSTAFIGAVALLLAIFVIGVVFYLRGRKQEDVTVYNDSDAEEQDEQDSHRPQLFMDSASFIDADDDDLPEEGEARNGATKERELI